MVKQYIIAYTSLNMFWIPLYYIKLVYYRPITQMVEYASDTRRVEGSNPSRPTTGVNIRLKVPLKTLK